MTTGGPEVNAHWRSLSMQFHSFTMSVVTNILTSVPGKKEKLPLSVTHPELAKEADGWDPSTYTFGSSKKLEWRCLLGHTYVATISNRARNSSGCPICDGKQIKTGFNDLLTKFPDIAAEADGWDATKISAGTHMKMSWVCPLGHRYLASVAHRTGNKRGCPVCNGKIVLPGFNDLAYKFPAVAIEADGWDPSLITAGSDKKMPWVCPIGHKYEASIGSRTNQKTNCPVCDNKKVLTGFNDLASIHPLIAKEALDWDPTQFTAGSSRKVKWLCPEGHTYTAQISNRTSSNATGCPTCGKYGFDPNKIGFLYLLKNDAWQMQQVGITNDVTRRLKEHGKSGWVLMELRGPMDGHLTKQWETAILRMLRAKGADLSNAKIAGKFDGYSEAWSRLTFEVSSIKDLMLLTEEFEQND